MSVFPDDSDGKEFTSNARDLGLIPGSGRSPGEENGLPTPIFLPGEFHVAWQLQSIWLQRVGHNWVTKHTHMTGI